MSNTKTVMGQASNQYVTPIDITDVFSTYLYEGNGSTQTITNGIDLAGEGGLVWGKNRTQNFWNHRWYDTERGVQKYIASSDTSGEGTEATGLTAFNSDGFTLGANNDLNNSGDDFASWTFRKAPNFFDVVTYTGTGVAGRTVPHNLGATPACIIIKALNQPYNWEVYHRSVGNTGSLNLNLTNAVATSGVFWNNTSPTETEFTLGTASNLNGNGVEYVAYLFAHNEGDGGFGPNGDQDIIKCGSFNTASNQATVNLGWEPQWVMVKRTDSSIQGDWLISDGMRGWVTYGGRERFLAANLLDREGQDSGDGVYSNSDSWEPTSTGFKVFGYPFESSASYIYIAIRRGPLAPPESGTEVFAMGTGTSNGFVSGFPVDVGLFTDPSSSSFPNYIEDRMRGPNYLQTNDTAAEGSDPSAVFDKMDSWFTSVGSQYLSYMWKRAPSFFDVVAYTGDGTTNRLVQHNLGVAPEMIWAKQRSSSGNSWRVWYEGVPSGKMLRLNGSDGVYNETSRISDADATTFTLNDGTSGINGSGSTYIAYLFATLDGVSKCGSYTGNGSSQTIDCGFTSGARFILIKRTDSTGDWYVWDTERGIVAGNDPHLSLNTTAAEVTSDDSIDPDNSGFVVNQVGATNINVSSAEYIFYAIA